MRFDEILYNDDVLDALYDMHFEECTPIQELAIPIISEGHDLIGIAQTGTGKTAAYLLPVIDRLADGGYPEDAINCIVMAPTRELAQQIDQQMQGFAYFMPVSSVAVYGGTDGNTFEQQRQGLKKGADVVIATPGRLLAHISMGYVDLSKVSFFILDEADRMLDMGFYDDIMQVVKQLPEDRQTLLFSATMPPKIKQLANNILHNPKEVKLQVSKPAEKIHQTAVVCYEMQKLPVLKRMLKEQKFERVIIFAGSKIKVKELGNALIQAKKKDGLGHLGIGVMHSDLDQAERDRVMLDFKAKKVNVLVATDIVARGIDIDDITIVVNYDVPHEEEDYVHRVGRTARAGTDGMAVTFVSERECRKFKLIERFIEKEVEKLPVPEELGETPDYEACSSKPFRGGSAGGGGRRGSAKEGSGGKRGSKGKKKAAPKAEKPAPKAEKPAQKEAQAAPAASEGQAKPKRRRNRHRGRKGSGNAETPQAPAQQPQGEAKS